MVDEAVLAEISRIVVDLHDIETLRAISKVINGRVTEVENRNPLLVMRKQWRKSGWYVTSHENRWEITYDGYGKSPRLFPKSKFPTEMDAWLEFETEWN